MEINHQQDQLRALGISYDDAEALRRISMTLRRWFERECGDGNGCIERDEDTGKTYWLSVFNGEPGTGTRRYPIADRETGARKRLARIMKQYPTLRAYIQGDPRGCALYILTVDQLVGGHSIDSVYTRGVAVG